MKLTKAQLDPEVVKRLKKHFDYDHFLNIWVAKDITYGMDEFLADELSRQKKKIIDKINSQIPRYLKGGELRTQYFAKGWNESKDQTIKEIKKI
jgi:hypothetical protein